MIEPPISIGIVGARGHTGAELIRLIAGHPRFELAFVSSRELDGQRLADHNDAFADLGAVRFHRSDATDRDDSIQQFAAIGTLFTLFVVPSLYVLIAQDHHAGSSARSESSRAPSRSGHDLDSELEPQLRGTG